MEKFAKVIIGDSRRLIEVENEGIDLLVTSHRIGI